MPPKKSAKADEIPNVARFGRVRNTLKMGIVGLPNVGKSSLFNLMTEQSIPAENFPFCTIDPNEARCALQDARYDHLISIWKPVNTHPAHLQITDIAGLVRGASEGAGLGNDFLSHIQQVDGIFHVVRAFDDDEVVHVDDSVDPVRDLETIQQELCLKDLQYVRRAVDDEKKDVKKNPTMKLSALFVDTMERVEAMLVANEPVRDGVWNGPEVEMIKAKVPQLITTKPTVYLVNMSSRDFVRKKNKWLPKIHGWIQSHGKGVMIPFSVEWEKALFDAKGDEAATAAILSAGPAAAEGAAAAPAIASVLPKISSLGYSELRLIHYFTAGEKEVRCWTVQEGCLAPAAAGVIHSDFEKKFVKAEVVAYADFVEHNTGAKGLAEVKAAGKLRQEGKSYVVQDGDIMHFMHGK